MLVNVARAIQHPRLQQAFQVQRPSGAFANEGRFAVTSPTLTRRGVVHPSTDKERALFLPEGVRHESAITIYCDQDLLMNNGISQQSDIVIWRGASYRVAFAKPWDQYGYWFAVAVGFANG